MVFKDLFSKVCKNLQCLICKNSQAIYDCRSCNLFFCNKCIGKYHNVSENIELISHFADDKIRVIEETFGNFLR